MYRNVHSNIVLKSELASVLSSILNTNESLSRHLPIETVEVYSQGFRDAVNAIAMAYDVDVRRLEPSHTITAKAPVR